MRHRNQIILSLKPSANLPRVFYIYSYEVHLYRIICYNKTKIIKGENENYARNQTNK